MNHVAIIPAGGAGRRLGGEVPKQYLPVAGVPLLVHTLRAFRAASCIGEILLAVPGADVDRVRETIVGPYGLADRVRVLAGGAERQDSVRNALACVGTDREIVLVHDAVRPCITADLIDRVVEAACRDGAVVAGVPVKDTVKAVDAEGRIRHTVPREGLWAAQTPQAFRREILQAAHERALAEGYLGTDEASLVERLGLPVRMIRGAEENIKVTTRADLAYAALILEAGP